MSRLRITQSNIAEDRYRIDLEFVIDGAPRQTATVEFKFRMTEQDQADLRWYLEDFLQYPQDPAPTIAARIEGRMAEIGTELFNSVFPRDNDHARDLWAILREKLDDTHIEVNTSVEGATAVPWELIRDPKTDTPLALRAAVFVRAHPQPAQRPQVPKKESGPIRILLVICRPRAEDDVPFRSVASRLIKGLSEEARATYQLDVLRPPTFEQLARVLRQAKADRKPYHVVHFDGHGTYAEVNESGTIANWLHRMVPLVLSGSRTGKHGFLLFENPADKDNFQLVDGPVLGRLLVETDVPLVVLNACRSAHAEAPTEPERAQADTVANPHAQVRAIGSLAQEVMDAGVTGVVAMRYNVYVVTAAQFVADLYAAMVRGQTLGAAVTMGRKQLAAKPERKITYTGRPLQDWCVPVAYESAPIQLFTKKKGKGQTIAIQVGDTVSGRGSLDKDLPRPPDAGFFGRDETLLALDRAFDTQSVVLLNAFAGSGKTATAAEFARWYAFTGGIAGPVLFTSFEQYTPLTRVLDRIGEGFGGMLEQAGVDWLTLDDVRRRTVALQVLAQVPVLWIWDNVEPIAGFPKGTLSAWSAAEQRELADFLRDCRSTKARFLLTSRRDEYVWLGDLPRRIKIPPMPMEERVQLARALAEKRGYRISEVADWGPLLRFTEGNPLTITVLVRQALRDGLTKKGQIDDFVAKLREGEAKFSDEASEGRTKSLASSLSYGFDHAFSEEERKQLALLHCFQGLVDVDALCFMGNPEADWCLPEVRALTPETAIALLDRAAEVGLLTPLSYGYYAIHPAVPWFFKSLFDTNNLGSTTRTANDQAIAGFPREITCIHAFVCVISRMGHYYHDQYGDGNRDVIAKLNAEEANLLHARRLARENEWWDEVIGTMAGLQTVYSHLGRQIEWKRLVDEIGPDFVDPTTERPRAGREDGWIHVTEYRMRFAQDMREWEKAERLQKLLIDQLRRSTEDILDRYSGGRNVLIVPEKTATCRSELHPTPSDESPTVRDRLTAVLPSLSDADRNTIRTLAVSLLQLGEIQREREDTKCITSYEEALDLAEHIGDRALSAGCSFELGTAYKDIPAIQNLQRAERQYQRSLSLYDEHDRLAQGRCQGSLGAVALRRAGEAQANEEGDDTIHAHLNAALVAYHKSLELIPAHAAYDQAVVHNQLGEVYRYMGYIDQALTHYRESIRYQELQDNAYGAARTRLNVAKALIQSYRFGDAREYAIASRDGYAAYGMTAAAEVQRAKELIEQIDEVIARMNG
jgi:tetratricopeptide (TPR) repeat protein